MSSSAVPKVYEILADVVRREGVETCFALLGDANMNWATTLGTLGTRMIYVRHEHNAVSAAMAHARATGRSACATVTCGPGVSQIVTALPAAVRAGIPVVVFAGESPLGTAWYNQELDQGPLVAATGAAYIRAHHIPRMAEQVRDAFVQAAEERRPVVVGVPFDLQNSDWTGGDLPLPSRELLRPLSPIRPHPDDVAAAASMIAEAGRVVILAGRGAAQAGAGPAARALADRIGALTATTLPARGLFHDDAHGLGIAGGFSTTLARVVLAEADLVIVLGGRLASHNTDKGKLFGQAQVLQIDTGPRALNEGRLHVTHQIRADARLMAEALTRTVPARDGWRTPALARAIAETPADTATFPPEPDVLDPRDVTRALDAALPAEWEMVNSSGHCSWYFAQMPGRPNERFHTIREFGAIGNGLAYAIGVATARPENRVVLFDGDGSILMNVQELETIRRHDLPVLICAMNDRAYGSEIHKLRADGLPDTGAVFGETDLAAMARGFGIAGHRVADLAALPDHVAAWQREGGAMLLDFPVSDRVASPVVRRAHPGGSPATEHPISTEGLW